MFVEISCENLGKLSKKFFKKRGDHEFCLKLSQKLFENLFFWFTKNFGRFFLNLFRNSFQNVFWYGYPNKF